MQIFGNLNKHDTAERSLSAHAERRIFGKAIQAARRSVMIGRCLLPSR
jgi:hypothetical protein